MSETTAPTAERTNRTAKNVYYRHMEIYGYMYIDKLIDFATTLNSRRNCSIDSIPKILENSKF